jgi:metal-responsive CopG/Arc/MetJ family transcriptional regulator
MPKGYRTISIPENLAKKIEKYLDEYGYRNLSEFVIDSARRRLEEIEREERMRRAAMTEGVVRDEE